MLRRNAGIKLVVDALYRAVPEILNVFVVCFLFFLLFGIVFVNFFKGALSGCQGDVFDAVSPEQVRSLRWRSCWALLLQRLRCWYGRSQAPARW